MNETLDRIGIIFVGIFLGGVFDNLIIGFHRLSIIIGVAGLLIVLALDKTFLKEKSDGN